MQSEGEGVQLYSKSFIAIQQLPFRLPQGEFQWAFFTSANGVLSAHQQGFPFAKYKIGVIAPGTAHQLKKLGVQPKFEGGIQEKTREAAARFASELKDEKVLLFVPSQSFGTMQEALKSEQFQTVEVYQTVELPLQVQTFDTVVLSSPSNARGFLKTNKAPNNVIAYGAATAQELNKFNIFSLQPNGYQPNDIQQVVLQTLI